MAKSQELNETGRTASSYLREAGHSFTDLFGQSATQKLTANRIYQRHKKTIFQNRRTNCNAKC